MTSAEDVFRKFGGTRISTGGFVVRCPAHEDRNPSLSLNDSEGGRLLWSCKAGCTQDSVRDALERHGLDVRGERHEMQPAIVYVIRDPAGRAIAQHHRVDKPDGKIVFWRGPAGEKVKLAEIGIRLPDLPLYGSELIAAAPATQAVCICEGEKAAEAARRLGLLGLGTVTGASSAPNESALAVVQGRATVYLWPDNDDEGRKHMARVAETLARLDVKAQTVTWPGAPPKGDAADFVTAGKGANDFAMLLPKPRVRPLWHGVSATLDALHRFSAADFSDRVPTGLRELDRKLCGGFGRGQMILVGAPTGGGKTTFVQQIAANAAGSRGGVLFISPEMDLEELVEREIVRRSGRPRWDRNPWTKAEADREACADVHFRTGSRIIGEKLPIYVYDESGSTMAAVAEAAAEAPNLALIVIDYAQEIAEDDPRKPRNLQVADVARQGVALARRFRVPLVIASQVNTTEPKQRGGLREYTFRETAVLEQKAHTVLLLEVDYKEAGSSAVDAARIICRKQRGGPRFILPVSYVPKLFTIADKESEPVEGFESWAPVATAPPAIPR